MLGTRMPTLEDQPGVGHLDEIFNMNTYCDVLPSNESVICGFWILYIDLLDKSSGGIYN
jgi:hypothetical protein